MKCSLFISNFLEEISSLSNLLFYCISFHWSLRKAFLSLLAILWNCAFKWVYLSFSPFVFPSLLFKAISKASSLGCAIILMYYVAKIWYVAIVIASMTFLLKINKKTAIKMALFFLLVNIKLSVHFQCFSPFNAHKN